MSAVIKTVTFEGDPLITPYSADELKIVTDYVENVIKTSNGFIDFIKETVDANTVNKVYRFDNDANALNFVTVLTDNTNPYFVAVDTMIKNREPNHVRSHAKLSIRFANNSVLRLNSNTEYQGFK